MPENSTATFGLKPIKSGASTVEPNIATTCCRPSAMLCGAGNRSSGATTPLVRSVHCGKYERSASAFIASPGNRAPRLYGRPRRAYREVRVPEATRWRGVARRDPAIDEETSMANSTEGVYRVIDVVGSSSNSWEEAAANAVETASKSLRDLRIAEVTKLDVKIENGKVLAYRTRLQLSFKYEG